MLVFSKEKLVFLSVPKTGTTAYQAALGDRASLVLRDPPELKHAPVFRYNRFFRPALEKFCDEGFDVLAVMREPIDWLGSWYRYRRRPGQENTRTSTHDISFDSFVEGYLKGTRPPYANVGSQAKFLESQKNGTKVTHLFRYEDQTGLLEFLSERLNMPVTTRVLNASPAMQCELDPQIEAKLRRRCAADFTLYDGITKGGAYAPLPHGAAEAHR